VKRWIVAAISSVILGSVSQAESPVISDVTHEPASIFDPAREALAIQFRLSTEAEVDVSIFDGRNVRIRLIESDGAFAAGLQNIAWDGRDSQGRTVPPEAYIYTIDARVGPEVRESWDPTDRTGGKRLRQKGEWSSRTGEIRYDLPQDSRVRIRIGLGNDGPLLKTLLDWVPRTRGRHAEKWDGMDGSGLLDLGHHPEVEIIVESFSLPENAILVAPEPDRVTLIQDLEEPLVRRAVQTPRRHRLFDFARHSIEERRDFAAVIKLPESLATTEDGIPIVSGPVPVRVSAEEDVLPSILNERCEAVFYVNGKFVFESQVSFLPMTWRWDPGNASGVHYISANLRGYEGHFGYQTIKVIVEPNPSQANP